MKSRPSQLYIHIYDEDSAEVAQHVHKDGYCVRTEAATLFFNGATESEAQAVADAFNTLIAGVRSRALEAAIAAAVEPVAAAAE